MSTAVYLKPITGPWLGWSYPCPNTSLVFWVGFGGPVIPNLRRWHWMSRVCWVQICVVPVFEFEHLKHQHFNFCLGHRCYPSLPNIFYSSTFPRVWVKTMFHPSKTPLGPWDLFDFETWCFDEKKIHMSCSDSEMLPKLAEIRKSLPAKQPFLILSINLQRLKNIHPCMVNSPFIWAYMFLIVNVIGITCSSPNSYRIGISKCFCPTNLSGAPRGTRIFVTPIGLLDLHGRYRYCQWVYHGFFGEFTELEVWS